MKLLCKVSCFLLSIIFLYNIVLGNGNNSFFVQKVLSNLLYILQTDPPHPAERWGGLQLSYQPCTNCPCE